MLNWQSLLDDNSVNYVTRGPNTKRGEVSIQCPFCGEDDPSQHLGISLTSENWGCHRNAEHRGRSSTRLIMAVFGCSVHEARLIAKQYSGVDPDTPLIYTEQVVMPVGPVEFDPDFLPIKPGGVGRRFWHYLRSRGFNNINGLIEDYSLCCAATGRYKDRVIIPFFNGQSELIGWTGRAIADPQNAPRYLSSSEAVKKTIFNESGLCGGRLLFITEGPFDAMKLDFYGWDKQANATCIFGANITPDQAFVLNSKMRLYDRCVLLLDADAVSQSFAVADWLLGRNVVTGRLPDGVKDPGAMTKDQVKELISEYGAGVVRRTAWGGRSNQWEID